jgi:endogenous inhibitor of DNA gyrase (YacG/DUF329 family)
MARHDAQRTDADTEPVKIVACPTCRRSVPWREESRFRPFCSDRCRLIDLGAWAEGAHHIPGDPDWTEPPDDVD